MATATSSHSETLAESLIRVARSIALTLSLAAYSGRARLWSTAMPRLLLVYNAAEDSFNHTSPFATGADVAGIKDAGAGVTVAESMRKQVVGAALHRTAAVDTPNPELAKTLGAVRILVVEVADYYPMTTEAAPDS